MTGVKSALAGNDEKGIADFKAAAVRYGREAVPDAGVPDKLAERNVMEALEKRWIVLGRLTIKTDRPGRNPFRGQPALWHQTSRYHGDPMMSDPRTGDALLQCGRDCVQRLSFAARIIHSVVRELRVAPDGAFQAGPVQAGPLKHGTCQVGPGKRNVL